MEKIFKLVDDELNKLNQEGKGSITSEVRKVARKIYAELADQNFEQKLEFCERLLSKGVWAMWLIAFDITFRERKNYSLETFEVFERWLKLYVTDWEDCDDFCVHPLGALVLDYPELYNNIVPWCHHEKFVVRRAAAVCMIYSVRKSEVDSDKLFLIADKLMDDDHYLVQKGYGWMLKEYSNKSSDEVEGYLRANVHKMTRLAYRYAMNKLDKKVQKELMTL